MRFFVTLLLVLAGCCAAFSADADKTFAELDRQLSMKAYYERQKLGRIDSLRREMAATRRNLSGRYNLGMALYEEYKSYKYDSAYHYATLSLTLARRQGHVDHIVRADCAVVFCLLSAGLYKEAHEVTQRINATGASRQTRKMLYYTLSRLYYDLADYNDAAPYNRFYRQKGSEYTDSLLRYNGGNARDSLYAVGMRQMKERDDDACVATFGKLLGRNDIDLHTRAIVTSSLGWIFLMRKDEARATHYLVQAALCDNESVTKETTALCTLAGLLYKQGDIKHATEYVQLSMDDANFYGARQRIMQTGQILPIIEEDRYRLMERQRNALVGFAVIAAMFIVALSVFAVIVRRQMKRLQKARETIEASNQSLQRAIAQLREANAIKNEYIGRSFYANGEYVSKIERMCKTIDRKIAAGQYEDARASIKESLLNSERENIYMVFDETFLKLFPRFVEKYNELFDEPDRRTPAKNSLTTEMRIFALIRLGVTDAERIATFLNYSVHTINTYKTRVKNRSVVENDRFEQRIMEIGGA